MNSVNRSGGHQGEFCAYSYDGHPMLAGDSCYSSCGIASNDDCCDDENCQYLLQDQDCEECEQVDSCKKCEEAEREHNGALKRPHGSPHYVQHQGQIQPTIYQQMHLLQPRLSNSREEYVPPTKRIKRDSTASAGTTRSDHFDHQVNTSTSGDSGAYFCHWHDHNTYNGHDQVKFENQKQLFEHLKTDHSVDNVNLCHWDACENVLDNPGGTEWWEHLMYAHVPYSTQPHTHCDDHKKPVVQTDLQSHSHSHSHSQHQHQHQHQQRQPQQQQPTPPQGINPFACLYDTSCGFEGMSSADLDAHLREHHNFNQISNNDINAAAASAAQKQAVQQVQQMQQPSPEPRKCDVIQCKWELADGSVCNKQFDDTAALSDHLTACHVGSRQAEYVCMWEGCERHKRPFPQRQKIVRHLLTHSKNKAFECEICHKRFTELTILKQHQRVHSGEKPYECSTCGKRFAASTALSVHLRTHTGEKPLKCKFPGCEKCFSESSNLAKHMKTHYQGKKPFTCSHCAKTFTRSDQLHRHIETAHPAGGMVPQNPNKIVVNTN